MQISKAARRYASAMLQLAREREELEQVLSDVQLIKNTLDDSRELALFVKSPIVKRKDKVVALNKIFSDKVEEMTRLFLKLIVEKGREDILHQIVHAFVDQYREWAGILEVQVYSAEELTEEQRDKLRQSLEERTGKEIVMDVRQDASLKGGLAVRIGDTVIDGTVKHKIDQLETLFSQAAA